MLITCQIASLLTPTMNMHGSDSVTFGIYIYSLAGLLIVVLLWVLLTSVSYVVIATHAALTRASFLSSV